MESRTRAWGALAGLLILTALLYAPVCSAPFVYEDENWLRAVTDGPKGYPVPSRALTYLSHHLTWRLVGFDPALYHAGNVALHLVNGLLVYAVTAALIPGSAAVWSAGVFLLHPLNSEAVNYVSARTDLFMTCGVLLAVWFSLGRLTAWRAMGILAALFLAAMSKEVGLIGVPLVALTLMRWRRHAPQTILALSGLAMVAGAVLGMAWPLVMGWFEMPARVGGAGVTWSTFLVLQCSALWHLLLLVVWPVGFSIDHDVLALSDAFHLQAMAMTVLCGTILVMAWRVAEMPARVGRAGVSWSTCRAAPLWTCWAIAWLMLSVAPRFVFRSSEFITEPQMYLSMVGISVLCGAIAHALWVWCPTHVDHIHLTERIAQ